MPDLSYPFTHYNPFTDEHLAPSDTKNVRFEKWLPTGLHLSVRQAKELVAQTSLAEIAHLYDECGNLYNQAIGFYFAETTLAESSLLYFDQVEGVRLALALREKTIPLEDWPRYMAALALAYAGEIYCMLWKPDPFSEFLGEATKQDLPAHYRSLQDYAAYASRASAYGVAFRDMLRAKNEYRETNRKNATKAHQAKHAIVGQFVNWALSLPPKLKFATTAKAAAHFIERELTAGQRKTASAASFHETLRKGLNTYCSETGTTHPFKHPG